MPEYYTSAQAKVVKEELEGWIIRLSEMGDADGRADVAALVELLRRRITGVVANARPSADPVEMDYLRAMDRAGSDEEAYELSIGLRQYRNLYKER